MSSVCCRIRPSFVKNSTRFNSFIVQLFFGLVIFALIIQQGVDLQHEDFDVAAEGLKAMIVKHDKHGIIRAGHDRRLEPL